MSGNTPRMAKIQELASESLKDIVPFLNIKCNDSLCSSVEINGTLESKDKWLNGIFHNASYFIFMINAEKRYYNEGENVVVELISKGLKLPKFRKFTGSPEKVIQKIKEWIISNK